MKKLELNFLARILIALLGVTLLFIGCDGGGSGNSGPHDVWTWMTGESGINQTSVYGTRGVPDQANTPGIRTDSASWMDGNGNLWLFGGYGYDTNGNAGSLSDLWKYDGTNWTWVSGDNLCNHSGIYGTRGTANPSNNPGTRSQAVSWIDANGNLWLFGGTGYDEPGNTGYLNDLWKFDGTSWTWVSGDKEVYKAGVYGDLGVANEFNKPGSRTCATSWIDAGGTLWLFGGIGYDDASHNGFLNDLWKFDGTDWTWISGDIYGDHGGTFGTKGVADAANKPGSRYGAVPWIDKSGNLWLHGGYGFDKWATAGMLNDLWKFNGSQWTWVSGDDEGNQAGVYGTRGTAGAANKPGGGYRAVSWTDGIGDFWLFGGYGNDKDGTAGYLNALWKFDGTKWTWISGEDVRDQSGVYGTRGVADSANTPGGRRYMISGIDENGNLWLYGGYGYDKNGTLGYLSDMWKYIP
ncbi:MAG: galactose oxidase [Spirochaetes bacterium]|nr:MAG: galactose oxidase [Spirochaetota bacterium]